MENTPHQSRMASSQSSPLQSYQKSTIPPIIIRPPTLPVQTPSQTSALTAPTSVSNAQPMDWKYEESPIRNSMYSNFDREVPEVSWGVGWEYPVMVTCLLTGSILVAVGHHVYYTMLDGTQVESADQQTWAIRIGTGLAVLNKTGLAAILGMVATQHIWLVLRKSFISIRGLDSMFKIMNEPFAIFCKETWKRAKMLISLAAISWSLPLITVVTPATLSVRPSGFTTTASAQVPTIDMSNSTGWANFEGVGRISNPSFEITRLFAAVSSSVSNLPLDVQYPNSSYSLTFWAPAYRCQDFQTFAATQNPSSWGTSKYSTMRQLWDDLLTPSLLTTYIAVAPEELPNTILIWTDGKNSKNNSEPVNDTRIACQLFNTSYTMSISFRNGIQSPIPKSINYIHPLSWNASEGSQSILDKRENIATSYVTHLLFTNLLAGNMSVGSTGEIFSSRGKGLLPFVQSGLIDCPEIWNSTSFQSMSNFKAPGAMCRNGTLGAAIEDLSRNVTISLMSSGQGLSRRRMATIVQLDSVRNYYVYDRTALLSTYFGATAVVLMWMAVGVFALYQNGVASSTSFSTIMLTTRNSALDRLAKGSSLGSDMLPDEVADTKLKFGRLTNGQFTRAAFGVPGTIMTLRKGDSIT